MFAVFAFRIKVSILLKMKQLGYQITEQNWMVCELGTVLLFNRFWFQNMPSDLKSYRAFREIGPRGLKAGSLENDMRTLQPFEEGLLFEMLFQTLPTTEYCIWPTLSKSLQISNFPFAEASWRGVNFHKSATFTTAPCWNGITRH